MSDEAKKPTPEEIKKTLQTMDGICGLMWGLSFEETILEIANADEKELENGHIPDKIREGMQKKLDEARNWPFGGMMQPIPEDAEFKAPKDETPWPPPDDQIPF